MAEHQLLLMAPNRREHRWWHRFFRRWEWRCSCGMKRSCRYEAVARREMAEHTGR